MKSLFLTAVATFGLTAATMAQVPSYVPTNGLVGWWPFNGNSNDDSGNGNNGTVNGATLTADRFGNANKAYSFDGNDWIEVQHNSIFNFENINEISISLWFKTEMTSGALFLQKQSGVGGTQNGFNCGILDNNGHLCGISKKTPGIQSVISAQGIGYNNSNWHHFTYIFNNGISELYMDGLQLNTQNNSGSIVGNSTTNLIFGYGLPLNNFFFNGCMDDIAIYNRALTQQEITALYIGCQLAVNTQPASQLINMNNTASFVVGSSDPNSSYQWQTDLGVGFQNINSVGQYSGATTNTLTVSNVTMSNNNQPFRCIVSSGTCSDTSDVAVLTVNNNASIDALSQDKVITIYPNPAQHQLHVKAGIEHMNASYSILDNTGRTVLTGQLSSENTVIELSGLSNGTYFLHVGDQLKKSFKVVKNQ